MILQSLQALYERLKDDPAYEIAPPGYSLQRISFKIVLHPSGELFDIQDARKEGKSQQIRVLGVTKSTGSGLNPCFLWDNTTYMLGFKPDDDKSQRTRAAFDAFQKSHLEKEKEIAAPSFTAVCDFLRAWKPESAGEYPLLKDLATGFGLFQIVGHPSYVHQDPVIDAWWREKWQAERSAKESSGSKGQCLITGRWGPIMEVQPKIKGISGGQALKALVGFNDQAYESYGKKQAFNAPVLEDAAFEYSTALNALLDGPMKHKHRLKIGDATVAFWTGRPTVLEDIFTRFAQEGGESLPDNGDVQDEPTRQKIEIFLRTLKAGVEKYGDVCADADKDRFFMLAMSPNAARIAVRFFYRGTVREFLDNLRRHYADMGIERQYGKNAKRPDPEFPPIWLLLKQTAFDAESIPPLLSGPLLRAILTGLPYPDALYSAVIRRIGADRTINYARACIIKGWLVRNQKKEVTMSLDVEKTEPGYLIGRLFAALEKTQTDALGAVGTSIRERFYSAASATPRAVFPRLLRLYQHHLAKLQGGRKVIREKLLREILDPLGDFPAQLGLADQGLFALGYYHQTQAFYRRKDADEYDSTDRNSADKEKGS